MKRSIVVAVFLLGCHGAPPEGVYPCRAATVATDCPALWYCRHDNFCWITDDPDAGVIADAGGGDASTHDATIDVGPTCVAETCNGADDDCDGLIDEGVITVGPAVVATITQGLVVGAFLPTSAGFGIAEPSFDPSAGSVWQSLDQSGAPAVGPTLDASLSSTTLTDAILAGSNILVSSSTVPVTQATIFGFDEVSGAPTLGSSPFALPLDAGRHGGFGLFSQSSASRATVYVAHSPSSGGGASAIRRYRLDVSAAPPRLLDARDIATDVGGASAVLGTDTVDYVVYSRTDGLIALMAGTAGDGAAAFHLVGTLGDASSPTMDYATLAIRDRSVSVSSSNPLGVAWAGRNTGNPPRTTLAFVEVADTTVLSASTPVTFPDAYGAWGGFFTWHSVDLLALSDGPEHWLLVNEDTNSAAPPTGGLLQVRELSGAGTNVRRMPVVDEVLGPETNVAIASSGGRIRVIETSGTGGLVTRAIGCE